MCSVSPPLSLLDSLTRCISQQFQTPNTDKVAEILATVFVDWPLIYFNCLFCSNWSLKLCGLIHPWVQGKGDNNSDDNNIHG